MSLRDPTTRGERIARYSVGILSMIGGTVQCIDGQWWGVFLVMVGTSLVAEEEERRRVRKQARSQGAHTANALRSPSD